MASTVSSALYQLFSRRYGQTERPDASATMATIVGTIVAAPFLHAGFGHLLGNTIPFLMLGAIIALGGPEDTRPVIVIVEVQGRTLGIRVDSVSDVLALDADSIKPAPTVALHWSDEES